jgi:hypothetical protein
LAQTRTLEAGRGGVGDILVTFWWWLYVVSSAIFPSTGARSKGRRQIMWRRKGLDSGVTIRWRARRNQTPTPSALGLRNAYYSIRAVSRSLPLFVAPNSGVPNPIRDLPIALRRHLALSSLRLLVVMVIQESNRSISTLSPVLNTYSLVSHLLLLPRLWL